jgi:hypothetical protein
LQDYVATRWYMAPELCGYFFSKVTKFTLAFVCLYNCLWHQLVFSFPTMLNCNVVLMTWNWLFCAVFTRYWHVEHRLHFLRRFWPESLYSLEKCGSSVGFDDWSLGNAICRYCFIGMIYYLFKYQTLSFSNNWAWIIRKVWNVFVASTTDS